MRGFRLRHLQLQLFKLALIAPHLLDQLINLCRNLFGPCLQAVAQLANDLLVGLQARHRRVRGDGFQTADARGNRRVADDLERPDVAGGVNVCAATQLG